MTLSTDSMLRQKTNARTRTYQVINGVQQVATADTNIDTDTTKKYGSKMSTIAIAGTYFGFNTAFVIRYVW